jgi:hypothetical protein
MVIIVLTSRLLSVFASRTRLAVSLGAVVAGATIAVPLAAGAATAATAGRADTVTSAHASSLPAASFPATVVGLDCLTIKNCVAVGANSPQMATQLVAERWNGTRWSKSAMPKPSGAQEVTIGAVACRSSTRCVAVGAGFPPPASKNGMFPIADYWNGSRWTAGRGAAAGTGAGFAAVSCSTASNCYAVGGYSAKNGDFLPLIEHWNGRAWSRQNAPVPAATSFGELTGVSCPSVKFCVAVGTDGNGVLIERLTAGGWSRATPKSAPSAMLTGVSCPSATSCFAVGDGLTNFGASLVEHWNGRAWSGSTTVVPRGASSAGLAAVSCVSASRCLAVGNDLTSKVYAVGWNGSRWRLVSTTATGGRIGAFSAVDCVAATSCAALAGTTQFAATSRSESAFWNGARWKVALTA